MKDASGMIPLFEAYPLLQERLPYVALAELPTPVAQAAALDVPGLYVKRDDESGGPYGGNKVRKLGFLLGRAQASGARTVLTFGAAGSNHALATAVYAQQLGLRAISLLAPQHNAHGVRRNLLRGHAAGAVLVPCAGRGAVARATRAQFAECLARDGRYPCVIPAGGSSPAGTVGFVNAAFELKEQIAAGALPEPGVIYVASGTMGTCIGLLLGLQAAKLRTRVAAVGVTTAPFSSAGRARQLFHTTNAILHEMDGAFPRFDFPEARFSLREDFLGREYGLFSEAGAEAVRRAKAAGLKLEGVYTGKAFAALLADAAAGALAGETALFWNTYNGRDLGPKIEGLDYHALPQAFHRYFEEDVQPLDDDAPG